MNARTQRKQRSTSGCECAGFRGSLLVAMQLAMAVSPFALSSTVPREPHCLATPGSALSHDSPVAPDSFSPLLSRTFSPPLAPVPSLRSSHLYRPGSLHRDSPLATRLVPFQPPGSQGLAEPLRSSQPALLHQSARLSRRRASFQKASECRSPLD